MRLDRFVSQAAGLSRTQATRLIRGVQVSVNHRPASQPALHIDPQQDEIVLGGAKLTLPGQLYLMLHKPEGVISATEDASQPTVLELVNHPHRHTLHVVGRLDKDTTGLLLLSNDGDWSHRLMSPRHHVAKTYLATLASPLTAAAAAQLRAGVQLQGERQPTRPALVDILPQCQAKLTLHEGKYHQVKRMLAAVGNRVTALHRISIGNLLLDESLAPGQWRELTPAEHTALLA